MKTTPYWCTNYKCRTDIDEAKMISALQLKSKFEFRTLKKKGVQFFGFPWCSTREDFSIDVSITNVALILAKLRWFQLFSSSQNSNFELFWENFQIIEFPCCSTREHLSIDVSITNAGLILTKLWWLLNSGYRQTDRHGFVILIWKHVGTQKISTQSLKLVVSRRSLYASPEDRDA